MLRLCSSISFSLCFMCNRLKQKCVLMIYLVGTTMILHNIRYWKRPTPPSPTSLWHDVCFLPLEKSKFSLKGSKKKKTHLQLNFYLFYLIIWLFVLYLLIFNVITCGHYSCYAYKHDLILKGWEECTHADVWKK